MDNSSVTTGLAIATPFLIVLLGGFGWLYRHEKERREAIEQQLSEKKHGAYIAILEIFFNQFKAVALKEEGLTPKELISKMNDANKELMIYASDAVLRIYQRFLAEARREKVNMVVLGDLIVAIRRDMGNLKTKITSDDILRQILTDYDKAKKEDLLTVSTSSSMEASS